MKISLPVVKQNWCNEFVPSLAGMVAVPAEIWFFVAAQNHVKITCCHRTVLTVSSTTVVTVHSGAP